ncbi:DUF262 domain-containing protein [Rhizobium ruizarguesonis]|uniref:DUF262 domain-containing protein n=1 Tax=Rhizobium ruizarguesonis TaxID=2081791 RepID=UPI002E0F4B88|nr:DUF262 domain-containing protein [Rhizobium ruizarguesonis]WSH34849.1 DUF262 domain-containing protein [Rhizobium ruizarguesonis]
MISSVQDYPVSHYFNPDGYQRFFIPKYQREYVWRRENWDALFNDVEDLPEGHFLGSIICVNNQRDAMAGSRLELVDGQQRFTTISLFFCALYDRLSRISDPSDDLQVELVNLRNRIFVRGTDDWRFEPSEQNYNKIDFQKVLSGIFPRKVVAPRNLAYFGNRRISKAYIYFRDRLLQCDDLEAETLLNKLKTAILVKIEVPSHSDAFVLFETINNRGIPLSAIDIIKNNILAELDKIAGYGIDRAFDEWKDLVDRLPDPGVQERFLRQLYNSFRYLKRVDVPGIPRATKSNLIKVYDTLIQRNPRLLFRELRTRGEVFSALINPALAAESWGSKVAEALTDLQRLGAAPSYGFLLWAQHVAKAKAWNEAIVIEALATGLTKWFFWRNLTDTPATRDLDSLFVDLIRGMMKKLRSSELKDSSAFLSAALDGLKERAASAERCETQLAGDIYVENYDATRFMLCKLEQAHQTRETKRDLWEYLPNGKPLFTVEHILPKGEVLTAEWAAMIAAKLTDDADTVRARCAHRIGNLTLSGYNSALGKMSFQKKRDRVNEHGEAIGYRNGLYLNQSIATLEHWDEDAINRRSKALTDEVIAVLGIW